ncbi:MAG: hypothetical protein JRN15_10315 [Nitrososphaerota archaeon]|nr:hypothetical protein [Nitrososphaerota archaeon]
MSEKNTVTVKLRKGGWEVEITCPPDQLQKAVESVLSSLSAGPTTSNPTLALDKPQTTANKTCRGLILELWEESWFDTARSLSEVHEEIARRGYHYDKTAVSHSLTDLVRENVLFREGNMRNYTYVQKRPTGKPPDEREVNKSESAPHATF